MLYTYFERLDWNGLDWTFLSAACGQKAKMAGSAFSFLSLESCPGLPHVWEQIDLAKNEYNKDYDNQEAGHKGRKLTSSLQDILQLPYNKNHGNEPKPNTGCFYQVQVGWFCKIVAGSDNEFDFSQLQQNMWGPYPTHPGNTLNWRSCVDNGKDPAQLETDQGCRQDRPVGLRYTKSGERFCQFISQWSLHIDCECLGASIPFANAGLNEISVETATALHTRQIEIPKILDHLALFV